MSSPVKVPSPSLAIVAGAFWPPFCTITVALRFYTRRVHGNKLLVDDWLTIPALVLTTGIGIALISGVALKSLAYPTPPPPDPSHALTESSFQVRTTRKMLLSMELLQIPALACVKLSFIFFYRRVFGDATVSRTFNVITVVLIVIIIGWAISFFFALLFACKTNFASWWTSVESVNTKCINSLDLENAFAISDFITDLAVYVIPIPLVWGLRMSAGRKLAILGIFSLGALAIAASITRMIIFIKAVVNLKKAYSPSGSGANDLVTTAGLWWSMIESGLGLFASCLPTIYTLIRRRKILSKVSASSIFQPSLSFRRRPRPRKHRTLTDYLSGTDEHVTSQLEMVPSSGGKSITVSTEEHKDQITEYNPNTSQNGDCTGGIWMGPKAQGEGEMAH